MNHVRVNHKNLVGYTYGEMLVVSPSHKTGTRNKLSWLCKCSCGKYKTVLGESLKSGVTKSCGCKKKTHKLSSHPLYNAYMSMHHRCYNPNRKDYIRYGARGIKVCGRWHRDNPEGLINFISDMGDKPDPSYSLDRIDNDKGYSPDNCKWSSQYDQVNNRTSLSKTETGFVGVNMNPLKTAFVARWSENSVMKSKTFSINKYGREKAFILAKEYRLKMKGLKKRKLL